LELSTTADGTHGGGTAYTTGFNNSNPSSFTWNLTNVPLGTYYYYCTAHAGIGGKITIN
jgi:plastocyanin